MGAQGRTQQDPGGDADVTFVGTGQVIEGSPVPAPGPSQPVGERDVRGGHGGRLWSGDWPILPAGPLRFHPQFGARCFVPGPSRYGSAWTCPFLVTGEKRRYAVSAPSLSPCHARSHRGQTGY